MGCRRAYLLPVMQTLVVVLQRLHALALPAVILGVGVDDVAAQDLLPEGVAAAGTCTSCQRGVLGARG